MDSLTQNQFEPMTNISLLVYAVGLAILTYGFGAFCFSRNLWPISAIRRFKQLVAPGIYRNSRRLNEAISFDEHGRLTRYPGRTPLGCPTQTPRTFVLLILGQSNAANAGGQRHESSFGDNVISYFDGTCYRAASPLLGASDKRGEPWTLLGNIIVGAELADRVVLIPAAVGGSLIARWARGGDLNRMLEALLIEVNKHYRITHVLWHQGEEDFLAGTSKETYIAAFVSLVETLRSGGVAAPIFCSQATKCGVHPIWTEQNSIAQAQQDLAVFPGVHKGINTDRFDDIDRYDDCHLSGVGLERFARDWFTILHNTDQ